MRALTLVQPWLHLITDHGKRCENRVYGTPYRGLLALHASVRVDKQLSQVARENGWPIPMTLPTGAVVAVAELVDVHQADDPVCRCDAWAETGPRVHHWVLTNIRALPEPITCPGARRLWTPTDIVQRQIAVSLGGPR